MESLLNNQCNNPYRKNSFCVSPEITYKRTEIAYYTIFSNRRNTTTLYIVRLYVYCREMKNQNQLLPEKVVWFWSVDCSFCFSLIFLIMLNLFTYPNFLRVLAILSTSITFSDFSLKLWTIWITGTSTVSLVAV